MRPRLAIGYTPRKRLAGAQSRHGVRRAILVGRARCSEKCMGMLSQDGRERQEQTRPVPKYMVFGPKEVVMSAISYRHLSLAAHQSTQSSIRISPTCRLSGS